MQAAERGHADLAARAHTGREPRRSRQCALPRRSINVGKCVGRPQRNADNACAAVTSCHLLADVVTDRRDNDRVHLVGSANVATRFFSIPVDNLSERPLRMLNNASGS